MRFAIYVGLLVIFSAPITNDGAVAQSAKAQTAKSASSQKQPTAAERIAAATRNANSKQTYLLKYQLNKGQKVRWDVVHVATTKTQMAGELEEASSRSESTKVWEVTSVDQLGGMTFDHKIESVNLWQKVGDADPVSYDSRKDETPPLEYESVAEKIGTTVATISINTAGKLIDRKSETPGQHQFGVGDVATPLPEEPVTIGYRWAVAKLLQASDEDGVRRKLKARIVYELVKVKSNNAYISFKTEVLTPVESEKIQSQIMQQLTRGYLVFDIDRGLPIRKEVEWDEKVQGFEGPDSFLEYLGRLTEKINDSPAASISAKPKTNGLKPLK